MKKILLSVAALSILTACQPPAGGSKELVERIEKLEKKVEAIEKRPAAAPARPPEAPQTAAYAIPVTKEDPAMGAKDAKINVVIFSDFQCPFCARVDPMLRDVVKDPELKDKVNIVFKQFPLSFHQNAKPAAKAALAAHEQGKFWEMSEKLYANQRELTPENFKKWAGEVGLNVAKFEADLKNNDAKYEERIKADQDLGSKEAKVRGTPSIYVNGWELKNRSVDGVKQVIKEKNLQG
jgi:protein-disulfide isomerase